MSDTVLDFGNGVVATGRSTGAIRIVGHSGLDYPTVEQPVVENSVLDGGTFGTARAGMRRMAAKLDFPATYTRQEIAALWRPGVTYTLTGSVSIPYRIDGGLVFEREKTSGEQRVLVPMISNWAYPEQGMNTADATGSITTSTSTHVECPLRVIATLPGDASGLFITTPAGVTGIQGEMSSGQVVVVDARAFTVTVDDVNHLDYFDRTGVWPRFDPGDSSVEVIDDSATPVPFVLEWYPRYMGLI